MPSTTVTTSQIENILLDTGVVYIDYGELTERVLAPTRGGSSFVVEQDVRVIERDGALGKELGLRRVIKEDAMLTVRIMDASIANLKMTLRGATESGNIISNTRTGTIAATEYFTNVTWIGTDMEGKNKIITLFNAMSDNGLSMEFTDKDETVIEVVFAGHRDPSDSDADLYTIAEVETAATNLSDLTVSTGTLEPTFAGGTYSYGFTVANATTSLTVTPTGASATWIKVNGTVVASGAASGSIALSAGVNIIKVRVHETGKTDIEYTIYVTREDA
jgi:hypothetical protein